VSEIAGWLELVAAAHAAGTEQWTTAGGSVQRIPGGFNNALYRVEADGQAIACKLCVVDERQRALREYRALRALEAAGLDVAPRPLGLDESYAILPFPAVVYRWLPGKVLPPTPSREQLVALLETIHQVQSLPQTHRLADTWFHWFAFQPYLEEMQTYLPRFGPWLQENDPDGESLYARIECLLGRCAEIVATTQADPRRERVPLRLCRADTNLANAVLGPDGRVRWVDWEYSGWGDPALELAELRWHAGSAGLTGEQHRWLRENTVRPTGDRGFEDRLAVWDALIVTRWCQLMLRTLWMAHNGPDRLRLSRLELDPDVLRLRLVRAIERAERFTLMSGDELFSEMDQQEAS
jgi:aminoglycoside phosphotransferase (APT) family kinase protein